MSYSNNPYLPKVRAKAIQMVRQENKGVREVARYIGVHFSTVSKWLKRAPEGAGTIYEIETKSSRPKTSPNKTPQKIVNRILELRDNQRKNGPQVIHEMLKREGVQVSFSTVYRTLKRHGRITERSPWKKWHRSGERPKPESPGKLVQMDTIHIMQSKKQRMYIFTCIDVHSRWAYAKAFENIGTRVALQTYHKARQSAPFTFYCVQSDHGPEFTKYFTTMVEATGVRHRHSRVRKPNDNAHVERFNRTIQEELSDEIRKYKSNIP